MKSYITITGILVLLVISTLVFIMARRNTINASTYVKPGVSAIQATYKPVAPVMSCQGAYEAGYFGGFLKASTEGVK